MKIKSNAGSAGLLVVSLLCLGCRERTGLGVHLDAEIAPYVPSHATLLAEIDIERLKATPLFSAHQAQWNAPFLDEISRATGIDPKRDLSSVVLASAGRRPVLLVHGAFTSSSLQQHLTAAYGTPRQQGGHLLFQVQSNAITILSDGLLAIGDADSVRTVAEASRSSAVPAQLQGLLRKVPTEDELWIVSSEGLPTGAFPLRPDIQSAASNFSNLVSQSEGGVSFGTGAHIGIDLQCKSADDTRQVNDALRAGLGFARLNARSGDFGLLKVYDAVRISYEGQAIQVSADLPEEVAEQLLSMLAAPTNRRSGL